MPSPLPDIMMLILMATAAGGQSDSLSSQTCFAAFEPLTLRHPVTVTDDISLSEFSVMSGSGGGGSWALGPVKKRSLGLCGLDLYTMVRQHSLGGGERICVYVCHYHITWKVRSL